MIGANKLDFTYEGGVSTICNAFNYEADTVSAARWQIVK